MAPSPPRKQQAVTASRPHRGRPDLRSSKHRQVDQRRQPQDDVEGQAGEVLGRPPPASRAAAPSSAFPACRCSRSSANSRMVSSGGMNRKTSQKRSSPSIVCIGNSMPFGPDCRQQVQRQVEQVARHRQEDDQHDVGDGREEVGAELAADQASRLKQARRKSARPQHEQDETIELPASVSSTTWRSCRSCDDSWWLVILSIRSQETLLCEASPSDGGRLFLHQLDEHLFQGSLLRPDFADLPALLDGQVGHLGCQARPAVERDPQPVPPRPPPSLSVRKTPGIPWRACASIG